MNDKTIRVCPFCGSEEVGLWLATAPNGDDEYVVECDNCGCIYGKNRGLTADEAVDGWNRREGSTRNGSIMNDYISRRAAIKEVWDMIDVLGHDGCVKKIDVEDVLNSMPTDD